MSKLPKIAKPSLTDDQRAFRYVKRLGIDSIMAWPRTSVMDAYIAGLRAGRKESKR